MAVADVNHDGKNDVLTGDIWYEAPDWKMHEIRKPGEFGDGSGGYSQSFACWADDINKDGWADLIVIGFPGDPARWYENPQNKDGHWKAHEIWHSACNETPIYADLLGTGKRVLIMGWQPKGKEHEGQMAYFTPGEDVTKTWDMHPISEPSQPGKEVPGTFKYYHGLGVGDVNGDGHMDCLTPNGWWEHPAKPDGKTPWAFHPAKIGEGAADMYAQDLDGDGKADILSSSAHNYGIWASSQKPGKDDNPSFATTAIFPKLVSQTHAMAFVDLNGDGLKDMITGKRWWAHGPKGDADPMAKPKIYWFEAKKAKDGVISFTPHEIDEGSGIGTQFQVADVDGDGLLDIITSNKKGVYINLQVRKK